MPPQDNMPSLATSVDSSCTQRRTARNAAPNGTPLNHMPADCPSGPARSRPALAAHMIGPLQDETGCSRTPKAGSAALHPPDESAPLAAMRFVPENGLAHRIVHCLAYAGARTPANRRTAVGRAHPTARTIAGNSRNISGASRTDASASTLRFLHPQRSLAVIGKRRGTQSART